MRTVRAPRTIYGGRITPGSRPGIVTQVLVGINVVVFFVTLSSGASFFSGSPGTSKVYDRFALIPASVAHGQWYRLVTAAFLHYGILHILFNMYALYLIGPQLEAVLGRLRFVVLYLLAGIGGGLLSMAFGPPFEQAAGASGAIFGLFGALYVVTRHLNLQSGGIVVTIAINLAFSFSVPDIDWRGHVGGLITGTAVALVFAYAPRGPSRARIQAAGVAGIAVLLVVAALVAAHHVRPKCQGYETSRHGLPRCFVFEPTSGGT